MNIESFNWNDLYKKAEEFIHKYIPEAVVNTNVKGLRGGPIVEVSFPTKWNKKHLEDLNKEKCFRKLHGCNVGGSRIVRGEIIFNEDGTLK